MLCGYSCSKVTKRENSYLSCVDALQDLRNVYECTSHSYMTKKHTNSSLLMRRKKRTLTRVKSSEGETIVELEGIEPSSKQGRPVLSTRLFQPSFSCTGKTWTTNRYLSLYEFRHGIETSPTTIPDFLAPLDQTLRNNSF